jgi:hypothetical protein
MGRSSSRWHSMNPMEWLKAIYETFGTPYPRMSLIAVMALGAILSGAFWLVLARQVGKGGVVQSVPSQVSGPASTTGDSSPANTGSGNNVQYDQPSHPEKKPQPPSK